MREGDSSPHRAGKMEYILSGCSSPKAEANVLPCAEKLVFGTRREAQAAATTLKWQKGTKLKVYQCRHCGLWHLASA